MNDVHAHTTIAAVIVATDGREWVPDLLASLEAQTRRPDTIVAVDNNSGDGTLDILLDHLGPDCVLPSSRDMGFPAAANMGVAAVPDADYLLILHDDVVLDPDTVELLARALDADPRLGVTGPKVVDHDNPRILRSMGLSLDRFGQVHDHVQELEIDQGQGMVGSRHLAVTSATMLVRHDVFTTLGGFDPRFEMYRDDLDLCWRVWLAGWEVAVIPTTKVRHRRAGSTHGRDDRSAFTGPHYFRERNTLASILKNVMGPRIVAAVVGFVVAATVRAAWYAATRRFQEAWQTFQAWGWNLAHLPGTMRRRRDVRRHQRRTTAQIEHLFAALGPQIRHLLAIIGDWLLGSDQAPEQPPAPDGTRTLAQRFGRLVRRRPLQVTGVVLVVVGAALSLPILLPGVFRLGQFAPFPTSGMVPIRDYLSAWHDVGASATASPPSPAQFLLGALQVVALDSAWAASRFMLLGLPMVAWVLAQVALGPFIPTRGPRVAAATLYVLSPPAVAAVRGGRIGVLVTVAMLPLVVIGLQAVAARASSRGRSWRGAAVAVLAGAVMVAFDPVTVAPVAVAVLVLAVVVGVRRDTAAGRVQAWSRLATVVVGIPAVLFPWVTSLVSGPVRTPTSLLPVDVASSPLWQWFLLAPDQFGFAGVVVGIGFVAAGVFGIAFTARRQPRPALALGLGFVVMSLAAAGLDWMGTSSRMWAGTASIVAAGMLATLLGLGLRWAGTVMQGHSFGWRQVLAVVALAMTLVGMVGTGVDLARDGWAQGRGQAPLPLFLTTGADDQDHLILTLAVVDDVVNWELVSEQGDTMASFGIPDSDGTRVTVASIIAEIVGQADPAASGRLGLLNIRYVVVPEAGATEALRSGLDRQFDLVSEPVNSGLVYRVANDAPAVGLVDAAQISEIVATASMPVNVEAVPLQHVGRSTWTAAPADTDRVVLVGAAETGPWSATVDGREATRNEGNGLVWFDVPAGTQVEVTAGTRAGRSSALLLQLLAVAFIVSVLLRPPGSSSESPLRMAGAGPGAMATTRRTSGVTTGATPGATTGATTGGPT